MKVRTAALAGAILLAFTLAATAQESGGATSGGATSSAPSAPASEPPPPPPLPPPPPPPAAQIQPGGWYFSIGAGYDMQQAISWDIPSAPASGQFKTGDNPSIIGSIGYRLPEWPIRLEVEGGYSWNKLNQIDETFPIAGSSSATGSVNLGHVLVNGIYDWTFAPRWTLSGGAGVGLGFADYIVQSPFNDSVSKTGFMWQGIAGFAYRVAPETDIFLDYRYRSADTGGSDQYGLAHVGGIRENVVMAGFRLYLSPQPD
ncbi:MAG: outer membrane beta-barrel protein [Rhizomicrobium sp.]|jgi:opacity protein-like surface antigen